MRSLDASPPFPTYAEPNYVYRATATPNDPLYAQQDDLHTTGRLGGTPAADPDAPEAWDIAQLGGFPSTGGAEIGIAFNSPQGRQGVVLDRQRRRGDRRAGVNTRSTTSAARAATRSSGSAASTRLRR